MDDEAKQHAPIEAVGYGKVEHPKREANRYTYDTEPALAVQVIRKLAAILTGAATYLITYGLLLTFGLLAVVTLMIGFATLPSVGDLLGTSSSAASTSSTSFYTTPTPRASSPSATKTTTAATPAKTPAQQASDTIRSLVRIIAFGAGFLAIWPAWFVGSLAWRHYQH